MASVLGKLKTSSCYLRDENHAWTLMLYKNYVLHKANNGYRGIIRTLSILDPTSAHRKRAVFKHGRIMIMLMFSSLLKYQLKKNVPFTYER